ncbi:ankyrin repeat and MYND domain-containing protein 1-like isoform X2 [Cebidichthys violaceus]|uniref:ankyrin repeat and MYND domain-containing protein 1-like isoform X2 n=1 Tax=Cebidichthys violaceus TaxID=271503 RepID=UPI0035C94528
MLSTDKGVAAAPGLGGAEPGTGSRSDGHRGAQSAVERRQGLGAQEWPDGSTYEGECVNGLKHGYGRYTWRNGEFYEGSFYKDYKHGDALYCWPTGHKFTGKFYLNRKEGYGQQLFPDGSTFQGLYHADRRFGPGVVGYPDGRKDVGLWLGGRLLRLCSAVEEGFSLKTFPEYAAYVDPAATTVSLSQPPTSGLQPEARADSVVDTDGDLLSDDFILPPGMDRYSADGDHLPLPPGRRKELDQLFYGEPWEPDAYQGYERDPLASLPLQPRMLAHMHKHRLLAVHVGWDVAAVLALNRESFGPKGPLEVSSELLIQHASRGELQAVSKILQTGLVHPDVTDSQGHTALIAATVNCHDDVIHLLLDRGVDVDKLNCEGASALAVCHVLYYPSQSLHTTLAETPSKTQGFRSPSACGNSPQISRVDFTTDTPRTAEKPTEHILHRSSKVFINSELITEPETPEAAGRVQQGKDEELTQNTSFDSACSVSSYDILVTEEVMQRAAEALSRTGFLQRSDTQETVRKMAAMKIEHRVRLNTLKLLLERGADPNASRVPMPVLFLAIMAADNEAVRRLLLCGARTDIPLPPERKGLYPLHVAAALPGPAGPRITELLLHAITDPDARACDHNEICEQDTIFMKAQESVSTNENPNLKEGGRTALHMACQRDSDYRNASKVVALLLSHRASTDLLWSGHSPLSLAIASGNELAVEELLNGGADPNIPLGRRVGSALCAIANFNYHLGGNRTKLLGMLVKAGADILMPVMVGDVVGTAVDYAHYSFNQDLRIACTPFHALNMRERETFKARHQLLSMMGDMLRQLAGQREKENVEREQRLTLKITGTSSTERFVYTGAGAISSNRSLHSGEWLSPTTEKQRKSVFKFCYQCGRSGSVKLTACRCHKVFYCSRTCRLKAWDERHKGECIQVTASADGNQEKLVFKSQRGPGPLTVKFKSHTAPKPTSMAEKVLESRVNPNENYSCN